MAVQHDRLYELLPAVYRERDAAEGYPLRALLRIIGEQAGVVERDIETLWNDLFIETCRTWVIPYIGDLVGNRLLWDASRLPARDPARALFPDLVGPDLRPPSAVRTRADVAKTIYYRRRKGTLPMLEELARDVTGWPVHAVEFFELLGWTQYREHYRPQSRWTDIRNVDRMERIGGAFDETSHTVDVRRIAPHEGWHGIHNVGLFVHRLGSFELQAVPARRAGADWQYHFSPLGNPAPLFTRWRREGDEAGLATELHVAAPLRRGLLYEDLTRYAALAPPRPDFTDLYGLPVPIAGDPTGVCPECSFFIVRNGVPVVPAQDPDAPPETFQPRLVCRQLDDWPAAQPAGAIVGVDPATGRIVIGDGFPDATERVDVYYHYGFPAELGGGPYERQRWLVADRPGLRRLFVQEGAAPGPDLFPSVIDALAEWSGALGRPDAVITVLDSRTYELPAQVVLRNEGFLAIEAANGQRPVLQTQAGGLELDALPPAAPGDPDRDAAFTLSGVVVEGHLHVVGDLGRVRLLHATLVPGRGLDGDGEPATDQPSLIVDAGTAAEPLNTQLRIEAAFSILGPVVAPEHATGFWLLDGILDGLADDADALSGPADTPGPALTTERSTIVGRVHTRMLEMSECIATGRVRAARTQKGCVRFSFVPAGSRTPRRYRCQPDLGMDAAIQEASRANPAITQAEKNLIRAFVRAWLVPAFTARRYGQPAYLQLRSSSPLEIRTGAEDGSEMGVYSHLKQPQRESNLRLRLEEYLPFGLEAAILYAT